MKINCNYSKLVPIHELIPNPKNTNKHPDAQIELLAKIIDFQGWRHPIIVSNRSGFICAGEGRYLAAKKNGYKECPVDCQDFDNEAQEYAFLESDNHIAELAEHDKLKMIDQIKEMDFDIDLELFGISDLNLDIDILKDDNDSDNAISEEKYLVIVDCKNECLQQQIFEEMDKRGVECKLMS